MGKLSKRVLVLLLLVTHLGMAQSVRAEEELDQGDEVFEIDAYSSGKYSCKSCIDIYRVYPTIGKKYYEYSYYKVYYGGKFHSNSEHFTSSGKCSAAYDSDARCRN